MSTSRLSVAWLICAGFGIGAVAQTTSATTAQASVSGQSEPDAHGIYTVGGDVRMPVATYIPTPDFSEAERKKKGADSGTIVIGLVVDVNGLPQQVHVVQGLRPDLDAAVLAVVRQYHFKPATKGDTPVPVYTTVKVSFQVF
jgi:TonB family protein